MGRSVTVFGSLNVDLIGAVPSLPQPGETVLGSGFSVAPGGKGANQALAAARAGASVRMVGAVGDDAFAAQATAMLAAGGVDLSRLRRVSGPTGIALILVGAGGENVIAVIPGANAAVTREDAARLAFSDGEVLLLQLETPIPAIAAAISRARSSGASVVLNFAPFQEPAIGLLADATHLVVNEGECERLAAATGPGGADHLARAAALSRQFGIVVIVTLGRDGVLAVAEGEPIRVPALAVEAVDSVGAGDAFCGYLAAGLAEGMPLAAALRMAAAAGSLACTRPGAQPAIPLRAEVEMALISNG